MVAFSCSKIFSYGIPRAGAATISIHAKILPPACAISLTTGVMFCVLHIQYVLLAACFRRSRIFFLVVMVEHIQVVIFVV